MITLNYSCKYRCKTGKARETREGRPLVSVVTKVKKNGDSMSTNERGHSLVGSLLAQEIFLALAV